MLTFAILHSKGGCAKTTTCAELAAAMTNLGLRVLAVDTDPQGSLTQFLTEPGAPTYWDLPDANCVTALLDDLPPPEQIIRPLATMPGLSLLPANGNFRKAHNLAPAERASKLHFLYDFLAQSDVRSRFDVALIDVAPNLAFSAFMATAASDFVLTPVPPAPLEVNALRDVPAHIAEVNAARPPGRAPLVWLGIVLSKMQNNLSNATWRGVLMGRFPDQVLTPPGQHLPLEVPLIVAFQDAVNDRRPVSFAPASKGGRVYAALAAEVCRRGCIRLPELKDPDRPKKKRRAA